ncbi:reverse transcriptase domain-containing protein [Thermochromatium tepidum]|uniref:reverse transcriptase domain-containing protein n=1 Tax=Thermochromatium tepidum TaxID=1050 RepID=UPI001FE90201|nr:reverse transcriptase domain-containing protein [Thermochromatium tepidum]
MDERPTPQGGPLSPFLANEMLDEVNKYLEKHGHGFVRYADDCNVYVRSQKASERAMAWMRKRYGKLRLKVNETKSAVASVKGRKFLGYSFWFCADAKGLAEVGRMAASSTAGDSTQAMAAR